MRGPTTFISWRSERGLPAHLPIFEVTKRVPHRSRLSPRFGKAFPVLEEKLEWLSIIASALLKEDHPQWARK